MNRKSTLVVELQGEYRELINYLICMLFSFYVVLPNTISDKIDHTTFKPVYNGLVYSGHPVSYSHQKTSQNFQLLYIFCKVDLYIAVTLPFPKGGRCTQA